MIPKPSPVRKRLSNLAQLNMTKLALRTVAVISMFLAASFTSSFFTTHTGGAGIGEFYPDQFTNCHPEFFNADVFYTVPLTLTAGANLDLMPASLAVNTDFAALIELGAEHSNRWSSAPRPMRQFHAE